MNKHIVELKAIEDSDDVMLELPDDVVNALGVKAGDTLNWEVKNDGTIHLTKKRETELVLVETVTMFRTRYVVETIKGRSADALDTVVMNEAREFSQKFMDKVIVSHRVISEDDATQIYAEDNSIVEGQKLKLPISYISY